MRTPRVCCCSPPTGGPTRWWVECFGKRHEVWDECGEPYHYMPLFDETTTAGQAAYQGYFGGIPAANSVWKLGGQGAFANGSILAQCGEIKTTAPGSGRRLISFVDFAASNGTFQSKTGCNDHDCKTHYRLKPCGHPFSQEVTNPPEIYWATDDYWDSVLSGGLPFKDSPKPGGCPTIEEATYLVNITGRDPYCAILEKPFPEPSAQEVAQAQPPGGSTTYTRLDNGAATGRCGCQAPACQNLFIFDPCPGSPSGAYSIAASAEEWETILGLSATPDAATPSTYAGYWRFKRLNPGGSEYGCCNSPGGQLSDPTPEFCGSLRPRNLNDLESDFCYGPGGGCDDPDVVCTLTSDIAGRIQIIGATQLGSPQNASAWFTELDAPPQTGDACDRHECTKCFAVNCGDGKVFVEGFFELSYSCSQTYQGVRTFSPARSYAGGMLHTLSYVVPYSAEMTYVDGVTLCDVTSGPGCSGPIDTSSPIIIGKWETTGSGVTLGNITLNGKMDVQVNNVFPGASQVFTKNWTYALPSFPGETIDLGGTTPVDVNPYVSIELQKRWGLRADVFDDELDNILCNANLSQCYTTSRASLSWVPKLLWSGSYFESDADPPNSTSTNDIGAFPSSVGFTMVRVVGDADDATCCESTPAYFNGPIIYANCADTFVNLNNTETSRNYDQEIQGPVGSLSGYVWSHASSRAHCPGDVNDPSKQFWTECGSWNDPEDTATGTWCDGYSANRSLWQVNFGSGGKIGPDSFWNITNNQTFQMSCKMEHNITAIRRG